VAHLRVRRKKQGDTRSWPKPDEILRTINSRLPSDVCLLDVAEAGQHFHARHDAIARTYIYQISTRRTAFFKKFVWWVKDPLDVAAMSSAAPMLIGRHNFIAFRAADKTRPDESPVVVVEDAGLDVEGDLIVFRITASHFVWRMVRRVVGALVKLGLGEITADDFSRLLEGKQDPKLDVAAWTAPASGLFLERVVYPEISKPETTKPEISKVQERPAIRESRKRAGSEERWDRRRPRR
jgi:tRNA pseudouridine38-40 synthase